MFSLSLWLEAGRWRRVGRTARLWWRDDDAAGASAALDRLLQASRSAEVPLTLAVVPAGDMPALGARLADAPAVTVVQHGVDHRNRRTGSAAGEFPHDGTRAQVEAELRRGWRMMAGLPGTEQVFTPPWNDVHPQLEAALRAAGYAGWSASGALSGPDGGAGGGPRRIDVHVDLLRWRGGVRFRGGGRVLSALAAQMRRRRRAGLWDAPIGVLTHHLVHDEAAWAFLETFLRWTSRQPQLAWVSLTHLVREGRE